jgi:CRP/FNR family transcriptional regulator, cyclic AMP receptor protein
MRVTIKYTNIKVLNIGHNMQQESLYREKAARLLVIHTALAGLSLEDAWVIVDCMQPMQIPKGTQLMEEGQPDQTDFMMLVLEGEVSVRTSTASSNDGIDISILGPGSLIGEMGVLDGAPRAATCVAQTDLLAATLARSDLRVLVSKNPAVGASLLLAIAVGLSSRLRAANRKIKALTGISRALQEELEVAHESQFSELTTAPSAHQVSTFKDRSGGDWSESGVRLHGFAPTRPGRSSPP